MCATTSQSCQQPCDEMLDFVRIAVVSFGRVKESGMATKSKPKRQRQRQRHRPLMHRKTFLLTDRSINHLERVQIHIGAVSQSETIRRVLEEAFQQLQRDAS